KLFDDSNKLRCAFNDETLVFTNKPMIFLLHSQSS
ncbi:MAG: hypothetical protein ACJA13_002330, partial [Paraglaciecola sp.]